MSEPREERPEWYEHLRADDAFPGREFTMEAMERIESRAQEGDSGRRSLQWRIGAAGAMACVVALAIWFVAAGPLGNVGGTVPSSVPTITKTIEPVPTESSMESPDPGPQGIIYYLKGQVRALPESQPYPSRVIFEGNTWDTYSVAETAGAGEFSKIVDKNGQSGWIPSWYLVTAGDSGVREQKLAEPYVMLVDNPVTYRLYPDEPTPSNFELWTGKVVQVVGTYGDEWLEIEMLTYDSPNLANKWVRKDELIPYEAGKAREGFVYPPAKSAVTLYDRSGKAQQELPPLTPVYIKGEQGDRYWILAAGGISGYMDKTDFSPNPFNVPNAEQPSSPASHTKYLKGNVIVHAEPGPNGAYSPFVALTTGTYSIGETRDGYVQITDRSGQTGWIPQWYSLDEDKGLRVEYVAEPYVMIVDKPVSYRMYPDEPTPTGFELWAGKVVQVVGKYGDWLEINVVTYDSPYMENKWVRKDELIPYEADLAKEGYAMLPEAQLYDENGKETQKLTPITNVYIMGEQGDRYWITAGGGISGYLDKKDFVPNPFNIKIIDQ